MSARVLVVDDDPDIAIMLALLLDDAGYDARIATHGADIATLAARFRPAVILLDVMLEGQDASAVALSLRADPATARIPIVLMSARTDVEAAQRFCGAEAALSKPFDVDQLLAILARYAAPEAS